MKINEIFKNEVEELNKIVDSISIEGCLKKYCDYIDTDKSTLSELEQKYVSILSERRVDFAESLFENRYSKLDAETLLCKLLTILREGCHGLNDVCYNDMYGELEWNFTDADVHAFIVAEMRKCLNTLIEEANKKTPSEEERKVQERERLEKLIKIREEDLEQIKAELNNL